MAKVALQIMEQAGINHAKRNSARRNSAKR